MRVFVGVKDIGYREFPHRDDDAILALSTTELIGTGRKFFSLTPQSDCLANEHSWQSRIRLNSADLIGFRTWKGRDAGHAIEAKALIDFRIDPQLSTIPEPFPNVKGRIKCLARLIRLQAVRALIRRSKGRDVLIGKRGLTMNRPILESALGASSFPFCQRSVIVIIHSQTQRLRGEVRRQLFSAFGETQRIAAISCNKIFGIHAPTLIQRHFNAHASHKAQT